MIDEKTALNLIARGEGQKVEFKERVPSKVRELSEEVCAFANASGGYIFIGIDNKNEFVKGFTIDNNKLSSIQDSLDAIQPSKPGEYRTEGFFTTVFIKTGFLRQKQEKVRRKRSIRSCALSQKIR